MKSAFLRAQMRQPWNKAATAVAERVLDERDLGNGSIWRLAYIEEAVVFTADAFLALTTPLPANSRVRFASMNWDTAIVLSTAVKVGLGTSGDPDDFCLSSATVTKNEKTNKGPVEADAILAAETTVRISACDTNGAAAGSITSGTIRARLVYEYITSIGNAA